MRFASLVALGLTTLFACKNKDPDSAGSHAPVLASAASAETTSATTAPAASTLAAPEAGQCEKLGCSGSGTFFSMCKCAAPPVPVTVKSTGRYTFNTPEWEVTNTTDSPLMWASSAVYYYDKAGKQLSTEIRGNKYSVDRMNGSVFTLKPKETKKVTAGFKKSDEPKGAKSLELVLDGWCFGTFEDKASHLCIRAPGAPDERPRGGAPASPAAAGQANTGGDAPVATMTVEQFQRDYAKFAGKIVAVEGIVTTIGAGSVMVTSAVGRPVPFVLCGDPTGEFPKGTAVRLKGVVHPPMSAPTGMKSMGLLKTCTMEKR